MLKQLTVFTFLICTLFSCKKETGISNETTPHPYTGDSTLLDYFAIVQNGDTIYRMKFEYDSLKRISTLLRYDSTQSDTPPWIYDEYHYTATNRFPYKIVGTERFSPNSVNNIIAHDSTYFIYDGTNKVIYDSTVSDYLSFSPTVFQTQRNGLIVNVSGSWNEDYRIQTLNNNLVNSNYMDTVTSHTSNPYKFTYDTKPNPLYRPELEGMPILGIKLFYYRNHLIELAQKNNRTSFSWRLYNGTGPEVTENYFYTYRSDGYPLLAISNSFTNKMFVYKYKE